MTLSVYIPLNHLTTQLGLEAATLTTADTDRLKSALHAATRQVEHFAWRRFAPHRATLAHAILRDHPDELLLDADLLDVIAVTNGDGTVFTPADVELIGGGVLRLLNGQVFSAGDNGTALPVLVEGIWGWHDDYPRAWQPSGEVLLSAINAATTVIPVQDLDGLTPGGETPRFMVGQPVRLEQEYVQIAATSLSANQITLTRGQRGTVAASHNSGVALELYTPPADIERLILRLAVWLYKAPEVGAFALPGDLIAEARSLRRVAVKA